MADEKAISEKLIIVQQKLKAPKGQYNSFAKFNYRSCEDITEAVKPLLAEQGLYLGMSDEIVLVGDRYYIKATVAIGDGEKTITSEGWAREPEQKKGMDASQITGTSSSYARKYALNGLFAIDDTKDSDDGDGETDIPDKTSQNKKVLKAICGELKEKITDEWEIDSDKLANVFLAKLGSYPSDMDRADKAADWLIGLKDMKSWATKKTTVLSKAGEKANNILMMAYNKFIEEHDPEKLGEWDFDLFVVAATKRWTPLPTGKTAALRIAESIKPEDVKPKTLEE